MEYRVNDPEADHFVLPPSSQPVVRQPLYQETRAPLYDTPGVDIINRGQYNTGGYSQYWLWDDNMTFS